MRLKARRILLGNFLYEVDHEALSGPYEGGVYRVGIVTGREQWMKRVQRKPRTKVRGTERLKVLRALAEEDHRKAQGRPGREVGARELLQTNMGIRKKEGPK